MPTSAVDSDLAAVRFDDFLRDCQTQSGTAPRSARLVGLIKAFKDARQLMRGDTDAGILDIHRYAVRSGTLSARALRRQRV